MQPLEMLLPQLNIMQRGELHELHKARLFIGCGLMIITDKDIKHCAKRVSMLDGSQCAACIFAWANTGMKSLEDACFETWDFIENGTPFTSDNTHIKDVA